jgi:TP901 family phage tail tape measure protein
MPALRGTVTLDSRNALKNLREFRREMFEASKTPTRVGIQLETDAAKNLRKLKNDLRGLQKLGKQHKVEIEARADTRKADQRLAGLRDTLREIGKNPNIRITTDTREAVAGIRRMSDEDRKAREDEKKVAKDASDEKKRLARESASEERKVAREAAQEKTKLEREYRRECSNALRGFERELREAERDEKRGIREIAAERKRADREIAKSGREAAAARKRAVSEGRSARSELGEKFSTNTTVVGVGLIAGLGAATKAAIEWEKDFTGVAKTVDATDSEIKSLNAELRKMATEIPVSSKELAGIAEIAGQLGIKTESISKFTKVIAELGSATNLSNEEAASGLAGFATITRTSQKDFDRLASTIVGLGNDGNSTEKEILAMGLRVAAAGSQIGLTNTEILAMSSTMAGLKIEAEAGGSAISTTFKRMDAAVRGGGKELNNFAKVAGMSGPAFQKLFKTDSSKAIVEFVKGLERIKKSGGDLFGTFEKLELKDLRVTDTLGRLAGASKELEKDLNTGTTAWRKNTAASEEARKKAATTAAQIQLSENNLNDLGITIGNTVVPTINTLLKTVKPTLDSFNSLDKETQSGIIKFTAFAGVSLVVVGRLKGVVETIGLVRKAYIGMRAMQALAATEGVTGAGRVGVALSNLLIGTNAAKAGFLSLRVAGIGGLGALGVAVGAVAAAYWGIRTAIIGTRDAGVLSADRLREKWGPLADIWLTGSDNVNKWATSLQNAFNKADKHPVIGKLLKLAEWTPLGVPVTIARAAVNAFSTNNNGAGESSYTAEEKADQRRRNNELRKSQGKKPLHNVAPANSGGGAFYEQSYGSGSPFDVAPIGISYEVLAKKAPRKFVSPEFPKVPPATDAPKDHLMPGGREVKPMSISELGTPFRSSADIRKERNEIQAKIDELNNKINSRAVARANAGLRKADIQLKQWRAIVTQLTTKKGQLSRLETESKQREGVIAKEDKKQRDAEQNVRDARRGVAGIVSQSRFDISQLQKEQLFIEKELGGRANIRDWDKARATTAYDMRLEQSKEYERKLFDAENSDEVKKLRNAGRFGEARNVVSGIVGLFQGLQRLEVDVATLNRLDKNKNANTKDVQGARTSLAGIVSNADFEAERARAEGEFRVNALGGAEVVSQEFGTFLDARKRADELDMLLERMQTIRDLQRLPELQILRASGRGAEADHKFNGLLGRFEGTQQLKLENRALADMKSAFQERNNIADEQVKERVAGVEGVLERLNKVFNDTKSSSEDLLSAIEDVPNELRDIGAVPAAIGKVRNRAGIVGEIEKLEEFSVGGLDEVRSTREDYKRQIIDAREAHLPQSERVRLESVRQIAAFEARIAGLKLSTTEAQEKANSELGEYKTIWAGIVADAEQLEGIMALENASNTARKAWLSELAETKRIGIDTTRIWQRSFESMEQRAGETFDSIITRQKSFGSAFIGGITSILQDIASEIIQSELHRAVSGLFLGLLGGAGGGLTGQLSGGQRASLGGAFSNIGSGLVGSFAVGVDSVPRDGLARVHSGEMILPKAQAARERERRAAQLSGARPSRSGAGGGTVVVNTYVHNGNVVANDPQSYQQQLQAKGRSSSAPKMSRFEKSRAINVLAAEGAR